MVRELPAAAMPPPPIAYEYACVACERGGRWRRAVELLADARARGSPAGCAAYAAAIACCERAGEEAEAARLRAAAWDSGLVGLAPKRRVLHDQCDDGWAGAWQHRWPEETGVAGDYADTSWWEEAGEEEEGEGGGGGMPPALCHDQWLADCDALLEVGGGSASANVAWEPVPDARRSARALYRPLAVEGGRGQPRRGRGRRRRRREGWWHRRRRRRWWRRRWRHYRQCQNQTKKREVPYLFLSAA